MFCLYLKRDAVVTGNSCDEVEGLLPYRYDVKRGFSPNTKVKNTN